MAKWTDAVITDKGSILENSILSGGNIEITSVKAGEGSVRLADLRKQTDLLAEKQVLSIKGISADENTTTVSVLLASNELDASYSLQQIGFYANDPVDGEILYAIAQAEDATVIPSKDEMPMYAIDFNFYFSKANDVSMSCTVDPAAFVKVGELAEEATARQNADKVLDKKIDDSLKNYSLKTETGNKLALSIDEETYVMTISLLDESNNVLDSKTIDFPVESAIVNASYADGEIIFTLQSGYELDVPISDLINGLVPNTRKVADLDLKDDITKEELRKALSIENVDNTADADKPISTTTQTALNNKVDKVSGKGLSTNDYTTTEKNKLLGISDGAEVNQNTFSNVKVGSTTISADSKTDTLTLVAGSNVTLTPDATNDKVTIAATNTDVNVKQTQSTTSSYRALLMGTSYSSDASELGTEETGQVYKNTSIVACPSTGEIVASKFSGALNGNATTATKVGTSTVGSATQPVYINAGTPTKCTYTLGKSVPSNAKFTDTVYTHPDSGATAGTYRSVTVDAQGHVTAGSNPTVTVAQGGTGATTAANARTNLGLGAAATAGTTTSVTSGSAALITSGAVYTGLAGKADYESGACTLYVGKSTQSGTWVPVTGRYIRIGKLCYVFVSDTITTLNTTEGYLCIRSNSLPFTKNQLHSVIGSVRLNNAPAGGTIHQIVQIGHSDTTALTTEKKITNGFPLQISFIYEIA